MGREIPQRSRLNLAELRHGEFGCMGHLHLVLGLEPLQALDHLSFAAEKQGVEALVRNLGVLGVILPQVPASHIPADGRMGDEKLLYDPDELWVLLHCLED